jgi:hypothetical protein
MGLQSFARKPPPGSGPLAARRTTLEPKSPELRVDLAIAYHRLGDTSPATAAYNEAQIKTGRSPIGGSYRSVVHPEPRTLSHYFRDKESYRKQFTK